MFNIFWTEKPQPVKMSAAHMRRRNFSRNWNTIITWGTKKKRKTKNYKWKVLKFHPSEHGLANYDPGAKSRPLLVFLWLTAEKGFYISKRLGTKSKENCLSHIKRIWHLNFNVNKSSCIGRQSCPFAHTLSVCGYCCTRTGHWRVEWLPQRHMALKPKLLTVWAFTEERFFHWDL